MRIRATKMDGCGNSFLVVDEIKTPLAQYDRTKISNALAVQHNTDGILYIDHHLGMPTMKIFDRYGTEETMCGNGLRCATRYFRDQYISSNVFPIATGDGIKEVTVDNELVEVNLGSARDYCQLSDKFHFVFTGVPHLVVISNEMSLESARTLGKLLREDKSLCNSVNHPEGVNVNFIWRTPEGIAVRTYEVGVEDVTLSCGTGSAASAYVAAKVYGLSLPIATQSLGGKLEIRDIGGELSIRGITCYQGKVIGFVNQAHPKSIVPSRYWQRSNVSLSI